VKLVVGEETFPEEALLAETQLLQDASRGYITINDISLDAIET
jgi:hypothetical protein